MPRRVHVVAAVSLLALALTSCTDEASTPIDLTSTTTGAGETDTADPNADARDQLEQLARDECRKDPSREVGVIVIADPETGEEVNRFEYPCDQLDD